MNKILMILAGLTALIVVSCRKEIKYKGDAEDPLVVVNCIMQADSVVKVRVERSRFFLEAQGTSEEFWISNATVTLTVGSSGQVYVESTMSVDGYYEFPIAAVEGETYAVSVSHPDYPTVSSITTVPLQVTITAVDTSSYLDAEGKRIMKAMVNWNDAPSKDYYVMKASFKEMSSGNIFLSQPLASLDPGMDDLSGSELGGESSYTYSSSLYFTDEFFDGQNKTLDVRVSQVFSQLNNDLRLQLHLYRCNEETYKYLISARKFQNASGDVFSEPAKVFSNITNGYGIFGAMTETLYLK